MITNEILSFVFTYLILFSCLYEFFIKKKNLKLNAFCIGVFLILAIFRTHAIIKFFLSIT
jgi:hypothetical protein